MAQLSRVKQKIFGVDGPTTQFGQIGSDAAGAPLKTKDLTVMQALSQYTYGLYAMAPNINEPPSGPDINSIYNLITSQLAYLMQAGVPEWETNTDYYVGSYVQVSGVLYVSIDGADPTPNQGNNPTTSPLYWKLAYAQDNIIYNQETFNAAIERVAANQYKFRDDITSLRFQNLSGGYLMTGGTSPLSGGDTWGYIETNNCVQLVFESGAAIHMGNERGYLEVNTDDCFLQNVNIIGTGTVASAIAQSFLLNANRASFNNCKSSARLSTGNFAVFQGSGTAAHNTSSEYNSCSCDDITATGGTVSGFEDCMNLVNCQINDIEGTGGAVSVYGFRTCTRLTNCYVFDMDSSGLACDAFRSCIGMSGCHAEDINASANDASGFHSCTNVSTCKAIQIDHSGSVASKNAYGYFGCNNVSASEASDVDTNGAGGAATGFEDCTLIAACKATTCFRGFLNCTEISVSFADNNSVHGFSGCNRVSNSISTNNTTYGFVNCDQISGNRSTGNGTGQYNTSYADFAATQAAADTAAGGYNG